MSQQRRRPTVAKDWQLAVLRKLHAESVNPTEAQRSQAAVETGLDAKWVKSWFSRQRSKNAPKNDRCAVPAFKLRFCHPTRRSVVDPPSSRKRSSRTSSTNFLTPPQNRPLVPHTTTYSRDPLCNRYPDFSQFFHPQVHERFESSIPISNRDHLVQEPTTHLLGLFNLPLGLAIHSTNAQSCPVWFSMRVVDLLNHYS